MLIDNGPFMLTRALVCALLGVLHILIYYQKIVETTIFMSTHEELIRSSSIWLGESIILEWRDKFGFDLPEYEEGPVLFTDSVNLLMV